MVEKQNSFILFELRPTFFSFLSYGYSKERFVWSLISAVGIFCLGSGATIVNGVQNLWTSQVISLETFCDLDIICYLIFWVIRYSL